MTTVSVRYIVNSVEEAIAFYRDRLGFDVLIHPAPGFASLSHGDLRLLLNQPGAGGAGTAGGSPQPGGWNRIQLTVEDLDLVVVELREQGATFRGDVVEGTWPPDPGRGPVRESDRAVPTQWSLAGCERLRHHLPTDRRIRIKEPLDYVHWFHPRIEI